MTFTGTLVYFSGFLLGGKDALGPGPQAPWDAAVILLFGERGTEGDQGPEKSFMFCF